MSDPKLIKARALIQGVLDEFDIAAFVILHNAPGELETWMHISPSYSVAHWETGPGGEQGLRFRSMKADYAGDFEKQNRMTEATVNMVSGFGEIAGRNAILLIEVGEAVRAALPGTVTSPLHSTEGKTPE